MKRILVGLALGMAWSSVAFAQGAPASNNNSNKKTDTPTSTTTTTSASTVSTDPTAPAPATAEKPQAKEEGPGDSGLSFGLRTGFALPLGQSAENSDLSKTYSGSIPAILDVGYRIIPNLYVGAYGQYGFGLISGDACKSGASCSGSVLRFGLNAHYHFLPKDKLDPWAGLGAGYEIASMSAEANGAKLSSTAKGFEFVNVQAGADYKVMPAMRIGPFASFALSQYSTQSVDAPPPIGNSSGDIQKTAMHMWLTLGVRGQYDL